MTDNRNVRIEWLPDKNSFKYLDEAIVKPTPVEAMKEEHDLRLGWMMYPQIGIGSGQSMIDVGSRYGEYTLTALALNADHVYAFEKDPRLVKLLRENLRYNGHSFVERCSVLNRTISPITMTIDSYIFNECSSIPKDIKWIKVDVGGQDELNIMEGAIKTVEYYRPINVMIHHYDSGGPKNFGELFLYANSFDCRMVAVQRGDDLISTTTIY